MARQLRNAGLSVTTGVGGNGVVGILRGSLPGRTVAYRADMDAVPPQSIIGGGPATAHVCGHGIHTTVAVGIARALAQMRQRLSGTVVFLFQPTEESLAGARSVLDSGVLERTGVQEIHALHCGPFPVGQFAVTPGYGLPGQDHAGITLSGPDAPAAAQRLATEIGALATVTPPTTEVGLARLVAELQTPGGLLTRFVATQARPEDSKVSVSSRCWPPDRYQEVRENIRRLAHRYEGAQVTFPAEPFPAMVCPVDDARAAERHLRRTLGTGRRDRDARGDPVQRRGLRPLPEPHPGYLHVPRGPYPRGLKVARPGALEQRRTVAYHSSKGRAARRGTPACKEAVTR